MKYNFESGRSMVEMLGTLAIIGVLSIGGIAGYTYAMNKYRANETINDINMRGIDLVRQVAMGRQTLSLSEWPTTSKAGYTFSDPILVDGDAYFSISSIPQSVCEMVYEGIQNNQTTKVEVNGTSAEDASACNKEEDNTMGFFFITNAGEGGTTIDELCENVTCQDELSCVAGICMPNEIPQFASDWVGCASDIQCGACEYCDVTYCNYQPNGSPCGDGLICRSGDCIEDEACTDNSNCEYGQYCGYTLDLFDYVNGHPMGSNKTCIKTEVKAITTSNGQKFYLSHKKIPNKEDAIALCASLNRELIYNYEENEDIIQKIAELSPGDTGFFGQINMLKIEFGGKIQIASSLSFFLGAYAICTD